MRVPARASRTRIEVNLTTGANVSRKSTFGRWVNPCATVFHPVDRSEVPPDAKILGARFVYRRKKDQNSQVTLFASVDKARPEYLCIRRHLAAVNGVEDVVLALKRRKSASLHKGSPSGRTSTSARRSRPWSSSPRSASYSWLFWSFLRR
jgi:hypothetical protein